MPINVVKKLFSKKCICCGKRGAERLAPAYEIQSFSLREKIRRREWNYYHKNQPSHYLCNECYEDEITEKQLEIAEELQIKKVQEEEKKQKVYISELQSEVKLKELERKAGDLGIDISAIKSKIGIQ